MTPELFVYILYAVYFRTHERKNEFFIMYLTADFVFVFLKLHVPAFTVKYGRGTGIILEPKDKDIMYGTYADRCSPLPALNVEVWTFPHVSQHSMATLAP